MYKLTCAFVAERETRLRNKKTTKVRRKGKQQPVLIVTDPKHVAVSQFAWAYYAIIICTYVLLCLAKQQKRHRREENTVA